MTISSKQSQTSQTAQKPTEQSVRRTWVTPTFERQPLKDALTTTPNGGSFDGVFYYS
jgi:hypothetical protein